MKSVVVKIKTASISVPSFFFFFKFYFNLFGRDCRVGERGVGGKKGWGGGGGGGGGAGAAVLLLRPKLDRDACCPHGSGCPPQLLQDALELVPQWYWFWPHVPPQSIMQLAVLQ